VTAVTPRRTPAALLLPLLADLVCVLVFAAAGKGSHEAGRSNWVVLEIVWPFAVAALLAHLVLAAARRSTVAVRPGGLVVLGVVYVVGMALRAASGRGLAPAFLVVALVVLAVTLLGWRAVAAALRSRGRRAA
jgi:hypothetical protein